MTWAIMGYYESTKNNCLIQIIDSKECAQKTLYRMETAPTKEDKYLTNGAARLWLQQIDDSKAWWNE